MTRSAFLETAPVARSSEEAPVLVLAHGAGAPMDSDWMEDMATRLGEHGLRVLRFEFPYMIKRRADSKRRPPDREPVLRQAWHEAVAAAATVSERDARRLFIGGKSLGGRIASMVAEELGVAGCICLGYPFHPPGKPERLRTAHLETTSTATLILQGERDSFGTWEEIADYRLAPPVEIAFLTDGDHGFKPRKKSGTTLEENLDAAAARIAHFVAPGTGA